jgi:putative two-component system response regulator
MRRPYKEPWPMEKILAYIHAGVEVHFDPMVVHAFQGILPELLDIRKQWAKVDAEQMQEPESPS